MKKLTTILIAGIFAVSFAQEAPNLDETKASMEEKLSVAMEHAAPQIEKALAAAEEYSNLATENERSAFIEQKRTAAESDLAKAIEVLSAKNLDVAEQAQQVQARFESKVEELKEIQERIRNNTPDNVGKPDAPANSK